MSGRGEKNSPHTLGERVTSAVLRPAGWGRAFVWPGGARTSLSAETPLGWEGFHLVRGLRATPGVCVHRGGVRSFWTAGLQKGALRLQTSPQPPFLSKCRRSAGRVWQGGAVQSEPFPLLFPFFASRTGSRGRGASSRHGPRAPSYLSTPGVTERRNLGDSRRKTSWGWRPWIRNLLRSVSRLLQVEPMKIAGIWPRLTYKTVFHVA